MASSSPTSGGSARREPHSSQATRCAAFWRPSGSLKQGFPRTSPARLYRSVLAGKRVLVVLDNARDEKQVRPLLPASLGCVAIVTSRNQLVGLVATEGASPLTLDLLSPDDARELLTLRLGTTRVTCQPAAVSEIIDGCARLPLALAVAAARAATAPHLPLAATCRLARCVIGTCPPGGAGGARTLVPRPRAPWH